MKILLMLLVIILLTNFVNAQNSTQQDTVKHYFTRAELEKFAGWKAELDFKIKELSTEKAINKLTELMNSQVKDTQEVHIKLLGEVIKNKDEQIFKLLQEPKQVVQMSNWKWYEIGGICLSSFAVGILTGLIIK